MNPIAEEIKSYYGLGEINDENIIEHHGTPHVGMTPHSGRYPYGSGKDPFQDDLDFLSKIELLKKNGWVETPENIEKDFGMKTTEFRRKKSICNNAKRMEDVARVKRLKASGHGNSDIARRLGINESTVRSLLDSEKEARMNQSKNTAEMLKKKIDSLPRDKQMIDVGVNVERELNISREKLDVALQMLKDQGYHIYGGRVPQATNKNGKQTTLKVLAGPDIQHNEIYRYQDIQTVNNYISRDGGNSFEKKFTYPTSMDSKRMLVRYADDVGPDGIKGIEKDGVVEIRRGVPDLSLGESRYAQVRILVDKTHYIKGMAVYSDDMPDGIDVIFNTNKTREKCPNKKDVLKEIKNDPDNPFGSAIKDVELGGQYWYTDPKTGKKKLGLINKRADEGDWTEWKDSLPSQFLSKQSKELIRKQLNLAKAEKQAEFDEIMSLNNPTIKRYYLEKFASSCDGAAVDLKAAALPGQKYHVIIPINSLGDNYVYAPQYKPGTKLALVRYPHGGIFEIPVLTVTDKNPEAKKIIGPNSIDAIGITKNVADRLSGADFDGDTVMCIPTDDRRGRVKILRSHELEGLKGFDPKLEYGSEVKVDSKGNKHYYRAGHEINIMKNTNLQMGIISNLISDMTLFGAPEDELAKAVRHSMVVIDAEKHKLDFQQSFIDNNIAALKKKWQKHVDDDGSGGASTIISKAKGPYKVLKRKGDSRINIKGSKYYDPNRPEGALIYITAPDNEVYYADSKYNKKTGKKTIYTINNDKKEITYDMNNKGDREKYEPVLRKDPKTGIVYFTNKDGTIQYKVKKRTIDIPKMSATDDAMTLVSPIRHPKELLYAEYANSMKAMANNARIEMINTGKLKYNPNAAKIYSKEVSSLNTKLNDALKNSVRERTAQRLANAEINRKKELNPDLRGEDLRKVSQRSITKYREQVGSIKRSSRSIKITDKEWEAIQAGAISDKKLADILKNSDPDVLRERALPKNKKGLNQSQIARIKALKDSNFTLEQIASKMNVSPSTISKYLKGDN